MGGRNSPLKYLLQPTAYANDKEVNSVLKMLESNFTLPFCEQDMNNTFVCDILEIEERIETVSEKIVSTVSKISSENQKYVKLNNSSIREKFSNLSDEILKELNSSKCQDQLPAMDLSDRSIDVNSTQVSIPIRTCQDLSDIEELKKAFISDFLENIKNIHPHWSRVTFLIMFLPGLVVGMYAIFSKGLQKSINCPLYECPRWFQKVILCLGLLMIFIFPIGMLCTLVFESIIVFKAYRGFNVDENMLKTLLFITEMVTALEAFFESGPQIIHQIYIACATREVTATQAISVTISMIMLAKTTVTYDMMYNQSGTGTRSFRQTIKYLIAILPLYISSVAFKAGSIAIFCMFMGFYAIGVLGLIFLVLRFITYKMGFSSSDGIILSLTNLTVVRKQQQHKTVSLITFPRFVLAPASPNTQRQIRGSSSS